jgi:hypothetical protein
MNAPLPKGRFKPNTCTANTHMILWRPGTDEVAVVRWPNTERHQGWSTGACNLEYQEASFEQRKTMLFIEAMQMIVRDKCDPMAVHQAMICFWEYHNGCSLDMPGVVED